MEQLNKVEIKGTVGSVQIQNVGGKNVGRFTVATNFAYRDASGCPVIETTWHTVSAWEGRDIENLENLHKGSKVYVSGRLRNQRYTSSDGSDRTVTDILAKSLALIPDTEVFNYQF